MIFRTLYGFSVLRRLVFRVQLSPPGTNAYIAEKELARSLSENYPFYETEVEGDVATFSVHDGDEGLNSYGFTGARAYRYNFGAVVHEGGPVMVQLGLRNAGQSDSSHLRVCIEDYSFNRRERLIDLMYAIAACCGESGPFDESRIALEEIYASFVLDEQTIEEVDLAHRSTSAGALETMIDPEGQVCGYQIGQHLDAQDGLGMPQAAFTRQVEDGAYWAQTREFALRSIDRMYGHGGPGVMLQVRLRSAIDPKKLRRKNLLAGLKVEYRSAGDAGRCIPVQNHDWNPREAWARLVLEATAVAARY